MGWFRRTPPEAPRPRITLIDRAGCHLCDDAATVIEQVARESGVQWTRLDVDGSPELLAEYADLVPVILVDGQQVAQWRITPAQLRTALRRRPRRTRR
jgi:hypothetical protein